MSLRLTIIILILAGSCTTKKAEWQTLDFRAFKLKTPKDWRAFKDTGIDAYIGGLTNGKDSLWFYYGWYISGFRYSDSGLFSQDTVNGKIAAVRIPKENGKGPVEMFIDNVTDKDKFDLQYKFQLSGHDISDTALLFRIFKSVTFAGSDTTKNGGASFTNFREYPYGSGNIIFNTLCNVCHLKDKDMVGPALTSQLLNSRTNQWLYTFFKDRKNLLQDSAYLSRKKKYYHQECFELNDYSDEDVWRLIAYLKQ